MVVSIAFPVEASEVLSGKAEGLILEIIAAKLVKTLLKSEV